jgi:hypothetical protein
VGRSRLKSRRLGADIELVDDTRRKRILIGCGVALALWVPLMAAASAGNWFPDRVGDAAVTTTTTQTTVHSAYADWLASNTDGADVYGSLNSDDDDRDFSTRVP